MAIGIAVVLPGLALPHSAPRLDTLGEMDAIAPPPWTNESIGDASKKDIVVYLQASMAHDEDWLKKHKLKGQEKSVVKGSKIPALKKAYAEFLEMVAAAAAPAEEPEVEPEEEVEPEPEVVVRTWPSLEEMDGPVILNILGMLSSHPLDRCATTTILSHRRAARCFLQCPPPRVWSSPCMAEQRADCRVLIRGRIRIGAVSKNLRKTVVANAMMLPSWRTLDFSLYPTIAAKVTNHGLKLIAAMTGGGLQYLDVSGCFNTSRAVIFQASRRPYSSRLNPAVHCRIANAPPANLVMLLRDHRLRGKTKVRPQLAERRRSACPWLARA